MILKTALFLCKQLVLICRQYVIKEYISNVNGLIKMIYTITQDLI